jgi:HD superfamily phosphohydrolase
MIIRDPVHGLIELAGPAGPVLHELLDTREVQRLRRIRQLGIASLSFPGAEHSRFGHALGTAHVMARLCDRLQRQDGAPARLEPELVAAAVAAALLHDVGHPPLSHVLETAVPGGQAHERWSVAVAESGETEVGAALLGHGLSSAVADLLAGVHEARFLCDALSSPLDVDRFDYLLRDSHYSGAHYGMFDLDWMLSSLRLAEAPTPDGTRVVLAVDGRRGLRAVEAYLMARLSMFQQVYFHKTGRAAEFMLRRVLARAGALIEDGAARLGPIPSGLSSLLRGQKPSLHDYLDLDDTVIWSCLRRWADCDDPVLARLAGGLLHRRLLRTLPLQRALAGTEEEQVVLARVREATLAAGYDPDHFCGLDRAVDVAYNVDPGSPERIWVVGLGGPRPLAEVSPIVHVLRGWQVGRTIVICPREARDTLIGELE